MQHSLPKARSLLAAAGLLGTPSWKSFWHSESLSSRRRKERDACSSCWRSASPSSSEKSAAHSLSCRTTSTSRSARSVFCSSACSVREWRCWRFFWTSKSWSALLWRSWNCALLTFFLSCSSSTSESHSHSVPCGTTSTSTSPIIVSFWRAWQTALRLASRAWRLSEATLEIRFSSLSGSSSESSSKCAHSVGLWKTSTSVSPRDRSCFRASRLTDSLSSRRM
mmetsp:Transcript_21523/g.64233  ORF Transcript_21523/g.64233 Transcript_21523/m.64233 type:complete len:223 (-) Transcript_21523:256-924(-)